MLPSKAVARRDDEAAEPGASRAEFVVVPLNYSRRMGEAKHMAADRRAMVNYSYRQAYESGAFHQFRLVAPSKLSSEARDRGINCSFGSTFMELLEQLDEAAAFSPILFETAADSGEPAVVFRDEVPFVPWSEYAVDDGVVTAPRPLYSPWQLLYLNEAVEQKTVKVPIEWFLDENREEPHESYKTWYTRQVERWHQLDALWRDRLLLIIRLQSRYGPAVKGTLTKSTVSLVHHPETFEFVDPRELEPPFEPVKVLEDLGLTIDELKSMHESIAIEGQRDDPLPYWHMLVQMAPHEQRKKLRGAARRAQDAYDAASLVYRFVYDLTGEMLLKPDEVFDVSDKSWKRELFGRWPLHHYTRADLAVELRLRGLHPHVVHLAVEGETEKVVCHRIVETVSGRNLNEMGVTMHRLQGVDSAALHREMLSAMKNFPRWIVLVADREGTIADEVDAWKAEGIISDESTFLQDPSFEEANCSVEELLAMIAALGGERGATLTLDAATLRNRYDDYCSRVDKKKRKGLASYALNLARSPEFGCVSVSKPKLAERIADLILDDLRERGFDAVAEDRPIVSMILAVFRVT
jgi:hypothetical protein